MDISQRGSLKFVLLFQLNLLLRTVDARNTVGRVGESFTGLKVNIFLITLFSLVHHFLLNRVSLICEPF